MNLYDVPQTADVADPAMASAVARFKLRAPKPEAITGTGAGVPMPDGTIGIHLFEAYAHVNEALADRMGPDVYLLQIDAALDGAAMQIAAATLYSARGMNRQAGADNTIDEGWTRARAHLADLTSSTRNKLPRYVDSSGSNQPADAPLVRSSPRCDDFVYRDLKYPENR